jgi:hypothetical protein
MPPFFFQIPAPPNTENLDSYIERKRLFLQNMERFERETNTDLLTKNVATAHLRLAEGTRDRVRQDYRLALPGNLEELSELRERVNNELEGIERYRTEIEQQFVPELVGPHGFDGVTAVPAGCILFDESEINSLQAYLDRIDNCIAYLRSLDNP